MKLLFLSRNLACICLALSFGLAGPVVAEIEGAPAIAVEVAPATSEPSKTGALTLARGSKNVDEPLYAGTSMWFLLSIALLGSIAVQRRSDVPE